MKRLALLLLLLAMPVHASIQADEMLTDQRLEARAQEIGLQLRCMTCPMQSLNDSDAPMARDMRKLIREQVTAGAANEAILAYLRERYGDDILLEPPVAAKTWALWLLPFALVIAGVGAVLVIVRRRAA